MTTERNGNGPRPDSNDPNGVPPGTVPIPGHLVSLAEEIAEKLRDLGLGTEFELWILESAIQSFDPKRALINYVRFLPILKDLPDLTARLRSEPELFEWLGALFSGSRFLTDIAFFQPDILTWLFSDNRHRFDRFREEMAEEIRESLREGKTMEEKMKVLRLFKKRETLRTGLRDLKRESEVSIILEENSDLAEVCCEAALSIAWEEQRTKFGVPQVQGENGGTRDCGFMILGLGKLGGRELNFSSDIDLIYVYESGAGETTKENSRGEEVKPVPNHEFFVRLGRLVTRILNDITEDGAVYRVDLNLRPEGRNGEITHSLPGMEVYYQSYGQTWERQVFIKARLMAGDRNLAREFSKMIQPFTYPKNLDYSALKEIREMKEKINLSLEGKRDELEFNVKLGYGGIREIEFLVQAFQLVFGGREPWLREARTFRALHKLAERGMLEHQEYSALVHAYLFFRELENRIQIARGLQVHSLPKDTQERAVLARTMGFSDPDEGRLAQKLIDGYRAHTRNVRKIYDAFFHGEIEVGEAREEPPAYLKSEFFVDLLEPGDSQDKLERLGFRSPSKTYANLVLLRQGGPYSQSSARTIRFFNVVLPTILKNSLNQPDPDLAIQYFLRFTESRKESQSLFSTLAGNEKVVELLCTLFGRSKNLAEQLVSQPYNLESMLLPGIIERRPDKDFFNREWDSVQRHQAGYEQRLDALIQFKQSESLLIGLRYLVGLDNLFTTRKVLSDLADFYLERTRVLVREELASHYGDPMVKTGDGRTVPCRFAVIALGKLGRREMGFGSDVDLMFVFTDSGETSDHGRSITNLEFYAKLCEKIMRVAGGITRHGLAYKVDARLRPEGSKGPLAQPFSSFDRYYRDRAGTWERLALTGARVVAGNAELGEKLMRRIHEFVYETDFGSAQIDEVEAMRLKMEQENSPGPGRMDIKTGRGGLVDLEFMTQLIKIRYSGGEPLLRPCPTYEVLEIAGKKGILTPEATKELWDQYHFLARLETHLRLEHHFSASILPDRGDQLDSLAVKMGHPNRPGAGTGLVSECKDRMEKIRTRYQRFLDGLRSQLWENPSSDFPETPLKGNHGGLPLQE